MNGTLPGSFLGTGHGMRTALAAAAVLLSEALLAQDATEPQPGPEQPAAETQGSEAAPLAADAQAPAPEPVPVAAEDADRAPAPKDATMLDTIEVTASKRVKSTRDLPGSVGALRGEELEKIQAQGMSDYLKLIPGVALADYESGRQIITIRGITSSIGQLGTGFTSLTTGIYVDEMPFNDLYAPLSVPDMNPFDLERVEVLKGPQGTLFGSGALAGAVRYVLQKPRNSIWETKVSGTVTQTKYSEGLSSIAAIAQNVPLGDSAALRFVGLKRSDAGLYDSLPNGQNTRDEKDINHMDQFTGRVLGSWNVTDRLKLSGFGFRQKTETADAAVSRDRERPERNDIPFASPRNNSFGGGNLVADYGLDASHLLYTGTYLLKDNYILGHQETALNQNLGAQQDTAWYNLIIGDVTGQTHELRWASQDGGTDNWDWVAGAAYMKYLQSFFQFQPNPGPADEGYYANPPEKAEQVAPEDRSSSFLWATVDGDGSEMALFGEATRRLGEHWELTLGARQFETELVADTVLAGAQISALFPGETERRDHHVAQARGFDPKFALRYLHNNNVQAHVLVAKGFQFGGFQLNPPAPGFEQGAENAGFHFGPYDSSSLWNYETALRTEWLDRRLRFDMTLFYQDWKDLQLTLALPLNPQPLPSPPGSGIPENVTFGAIVNVARAHSEGLEAALEVAPFAGAVFTSTAAWISALTDEEFDTTNTAGPVPVGTRLPGTARFQVANQAAYQFTLPWFSGWDASVALTHSHIGTSPNSIRPTSDINGFDTLDVRLGFLRPNSPYVPNVSLGMNNITDVRGAVVAARNNTGSAYVFVRPRTTLLNLSWKY